MSKSIQYFDGGGEFDPNAGRQELYDTRWANYLKAFEQSNTKFKLGDARASFDKQFNEDWAKGEQERRLKFNADQAAKKYEASKKAFWDAANAMTPDDTLSHPSDTEMNALDNTMQQGAQDAIAQRLNQKKAQQSSDYWTNIAKQNGFTDMEAVKKWQAENGLAADGKFGSKSKAKWDELQTAKQTTSSESSESSEDSWFAPINYYNSFKKYASNPITLRSTGELLGDLTYRNAWKTTKEGLSGLWNAGKEFFGGFFQDGGNINYYQQGGNMNNEQELQKAFMAFLIEDAAAQGVQIQSEQDLKAYAEQLGEEGLKAKYQEFMQKMQGGVKAKLGAKLNYIRKIKGNCPEGEELVYMKEGGRVCAKCMRKAQDGTKTPEKPKNAVQKFKDKKKKPTTPLPTKYDGVKHEKLAELHAFKKASPAQIDSLNAYGKLYRELPDSIKVRDYNDQEVQAKACGGKTKKNR